MTFLNDVSLGLAYAVIYWWAYIPAILAYALFVSYRDYKITETIRNIQWVLLEVKTPGDLEKSPKVTEQVFAGLHGILSPIKAREVFFQGKITKWFSMEIIGIGGDIHFYIRTPAEYRNLVEAQIFAQYPDAEITEAADYVNDVPEKLPDANYDLWGAEYKLAKEDAFPIRTYVEFEEAGGLGEAKRVDPLASFSETLSNLKSGEQIWIQMILLPTGPETGDKWQDKGADMLDKLAGREKKEEKKLGIAGALAGQLHNIITEAGGSKKEEKKEEKKELIPPRTPLEEEQMKGITRKIAKVGFRCGVRFVYVAHREVFNMGHVAGVGGALKQFSSGNLNGFKSEFTTSGKGWFRWFFPSGKGFFSAEEAIEKKRMLYEAARNRGLPLVPSSVLNTEELATLYHLPGLAVRTPFLPRVLSKKGQPPAFLPEK